MLIPRSSKPSGYAAHPDEEYSNHLHNTSPDRSPRCQPESSTLLSLPDDSLGHGTIFLSQVSNTSRSVERDEKIESLKRNVDSSLVQTHVNAYPSKQVRNNPNSPEDNLNSNDWVRLSNDIGDKSLVAGDTLYDVFVDDRVVDELTASYTWHPDYHHPGALWGLVITPYLGINFFLNLKEKNHSI